MIFTLVHHSIRILFCQQNFCKSIFKGGIEDNIIFYIPDVITDSQYLYLKSHKKEYSIYRNNISIVNIKIDDNQFLIEEIDQFQISDDERMIDVLYDLIDDKYRMEKQIKNKR